jgi:competence protein ComEA
MSFKTIVAAALFTAAASTAFAQQTQQPQQPNPLRPGQPAQPATPAQPAQPTQSRPATPAAPAQAAQPAQRPAAQGTLVNLNSATKAELETLPQIGPARADAIIAKRPYRDWTDFVAKNVVPANAEREIQAKVRFR